MPENAQFVPIVYDSPHSGRLYEPILSTWKPRATLLELRRGEDAYMDVVLRDLCQKAGVTLLLQHYPRCYLDVNRAADDVDEESLLQEPWPLGARPTEKSRKGLGLIRRLVRPGCPIYHEGEKLSADEVMRRLQLAYWPYHGALTSALHSLTRRHKEVVHINWYAQGRGLYIHAEEGVELLWGTQVASLQPSVSPGEGATSLANGPCTIAAM